MHTGLRDFNYRIATWTAWVAEQREPLVLTKHKKPHVALVPADRWERAEQAEAVMDGLLNLARRDASCEEYAGFAEMLRTMVDNIGCENTETRT